VAHRSLGQPVGMPLTGTYAPDAVDWRREQTERYEATDGAEANTFQDRPIVVMTSVGARSGALRKNPVMRIEHDGAYAVVASNGGSTGHPSWYRNLVEHPRVELQDRAERHDYVAREVDGEEKRAWWARAVAAYPDFDDYQAAVEREIPLLVLTRSDPDPDPDSPR
jgi:deazaflavin-dependent oxidoreductase (nitroreductase family)